MPDTVIRCRFDVNHEVFAGGFYDVRWFRSDDLDKLVEITRERSHCGITPSAAGQDLYRGAIQDWLPKALPISEDEIKPRRLAPDAMASGDEISPRRAVKAR
jgi:hypothetical protein